MGPGKGKVENEEGEEGGEGERAIRNRGSTEVAINPKSKRG